VSDITIVTGQPFRVLCLDGGGMRGIYTASYISHLAQGFSAKRGVGPLDVGAGFNLIVGTSTGAIIGCALAAGVPSERILRLYRDHGPQIFRRRVPPGMGIQLVTDLKKRPTALRLGELALRQALTDCLKATTIEDVYRNRNIALAITAVDMSRHRSWVFKTPHDPNSNHRDDKYTLVEVCLASSAAPIFRSLAAIDTPGDATTYTVFADGGMWANSPVLVALIEALGMTEAKRPIEIYCLGTCPLPAGEQISKDAAHRGLLQWRFGADAASLSVDIQEFAFDRMARMLAKHVARECSIIRFPRDEVPAAMMQYLDLDETRPEAADSLIQLAKSDANMTNSKCGNANDREGQMMDRLFREMPMLEQALSTGGN
jgi:uncharacterized protein